MLLDEQIRAMVDDELVRAHRRRAMSPERPVTRGTAQNPETFFQARETVKPFYLTTPVIVQRAMDRLAVQIGRAHVCTQVNNAPHVCSPLLVNNNHVSNRRNPN